MHASVARERDLGLIAGAVRREEALDVGGAHHVLAIDREDHVILFDAALLGGTPRHHLADDRAAHLAETVLLEIVLLHIAHADAERDAAAIHRLLLLRRRLLRIPRLI